MKKTDRPEYCPENDFNLSIPEEPLVVLETFGHALGCIPGLTSIDILPDLPQLFFLRNGYCGCIWNLFSIPSGVQPRCGSCPSNTYIWVPLMYVTTYYTIICFNILKNYIWNGRDVSAIESVFCSCRGLDIYSSTSISRLQPPVGPTLWYLMPPSGLNGHCNHVHRPIYKTRHVHIIWRINKNKCLHQCCLSCIFTFTKVFLV